RGGGGGGDSGFRGVATGGDDGIGGEVAGHDGRRRSRQGVLLRGALEDLPDAIVAAREGGPTLEAEAAAEARGDAAHGQGVLDGQGSRAGHGIDEGEGGIDPAEAEHGGGQRLLEGASVMATR